MISTRLNTPPILRALTVALALVLWLPAHMAWGNPQFQKAVKHFKDFEINDAVKILKQLQDDASLSKSMQAKVALYLGMSYAYLRKKDLAKTSFKQAVTTMPSIKLPKGTPKRLQALFKAAGGQSGTAAPAATPRPAPTTPRVDPPARTQPPPARRQTMSFGGDPVPVRRPAPVRRSEPPPRRGMSFGGGFTLRRRPAPAPRRAEPSFDPPPRRRAEPSFDPPPRRRATPDMTFTPPRREPARTSPPPSRPRDRVALGSSDPDAAGLFGTKKKTTPKSQGGNKGMWIAAWVTAISAVLIAGGGAGFGAFAQSKRDQAAQDAIQIDVPIAESDAGSFATIANVMFISAGAVGIGAVIFFVLAARSPKAPPKTAGLSPSPRMGPPAQKTPPPAHATTKLLTTSHP